jgi:methylated-DNA-protein-cysteine methyltransferase-like protein
VTAAARAGGGDSYARIYTVVRRIPRGRVATYGQVAALAGRARQARLVGYALHALPARTAVPWHRVVNAQGRISLRRTSPAAGLTQRLLLEREGVRFDARGRLSLERYGWRPGRRSRHLT